MKKLYIVIGGDVGSGKTTHAKLLVNYFNINGLKASYKTIKAFHSIAYYLTLLILIARYNPKLILKM